MIEGHNSTHANVTFTLRKVTVSESEGNYYVTEIAGSQKNLETSFSIVGGVLGYMSMEGLLTKGKRKNVYTETYADSNMLRVHQDSTVTRDATTAKLKLAFDGENRHDVYEEFLIYINNGIVEWYDTARKRYAYFILVDSVEPSEDEWKKGKYVVCEFKLQNILGNTFRTKDQTTGKLTE